MTNDSCGDVLGTEVEVREYRVAVSAEQLALAWLRGEGARSGSVVVVDHEIVPRQRLGVPWTVPPPQSLSFAAVLRCRLSVEDETMLWIAALVSVARAFETLDVPPPMLGWPDGLIARDAASCGSVVVEAQLGQGVVQSAIVSVRIDTEHVSVAKHSARPLALAFTRELHHIMSRLETMRADLLSEYDARSAIIGRRVSVRLLPKGNTRGTVMALTGVGNLAIESPTAMIEVLTPANVVSVVLM